MLHITRLFVRIGAAFLATWLTTAPLGAWANDPRARFDQSALDAMIAPIALYPDQLLTQVLMAATYPEEVQAAARFARERPGLSGDAAVRTAEGFDWDPSVRSLTAFPHVLETMSQHTAWTEDLGQAFIAQPQEVMDTVQRLRYRAYEAGTLVSNDYTRVINTGSSLIIESVRPQLVYVPHYDSQVVYGPWLWPARPPMVWSRWHGYYEPYNRPSIVHWGPGVALGSGFFFGGFDWPRREVRVVNTRPYYYAHRDHRHAQVHAAPHAWRHDGERRAAWRQRVQPVESTRVPVQRTPQATGAHAPRGAQPQADGNDPRFDRRTRRSRDSDGDDTRPPSAPVRAGVNPIPPQAVERPVQRAPQATVAPVPHGVQPQADGNDPRFDRRARRSRDSDGESDARVSAPVRPSVSPASPQTGSVPREAPRGNIEERRSRALGRD